MADRSQGMERHVEVALQVASAREAEALEAYALALRRYAAGQLPPEILAREAVDLYARSAVEALTLYAALGEQCCRLALSVAGVQVQSAGGATLAGADVQGGLHGSGREGS